LKVSLDQGHLGKNYQLNSEEKQSRGCQTNSRSSNWSVFVVILIRYWWGWAKEETDEKRFGTKTKSRLSQDIVHQHVWCSSRPEGHRRAGTGAKEKTVEGADKYEKMQLEAQLKLKEEELKMKKWRPWSQA
jgi:hypothetical protein